MKETKKQSKEQSLNVIISLIVYPFDVMFSFGETDDELKKTLTRFQIQWQDVLKLSGVGRCVTFDTNQTVIRLDQIPKSSADYGTLQHEIFHAVDQIFRRIGMNLSEDSDEAYAYLIGYLTTQIYEML